MNYSRFLIKDDFELYGVQPGKVHPLNYLQIELTDRCNLRCINCLRADTLSSGMILSLEAFLGLIDQVPSVQHISFVGSGEALLVENFPEYISHCTERGIYSSSNTNGILVEKRLMPVIEAGLGKIALSVDAGETGLLSQIRPGIDLSTLERSMRCTVEMTQGTSTEVSAAVTLSSFNIDQFSDTIRFINSTGIKDITVESLHHWGVDKSLNRFSLFHIAPERVFGKIEEGLEIAMGYGLKLRIFDYYKLLQKNSTPHHCSWPWDSMMITSSGDVTPCCVNLESSEFNRMGNILCESVESIWSGCRYNDLRKSFYNNKLWQICVDCVYMKQFGKTAELT